MRVNPLCLVPSFPPPAILKCHATGELLPVKLVLPNHDYLVIPPKRGAPVPRWGVAVNVKWLWFFEAEVGKGGGMHWLGEQ